MRRPCFAEGDIGLASLTEPTTTTTTRAAPFFSRSTKRSPTYRTLSTFGSSNSSPRWCPSKLYDPRCEEPHFLESCFLCKKPLGGNRDIFMYRGDTPFCSEECREEQIEMDEAKEKKLNLSASMKAIRKETTKSTPNKSQNYQPRTSPVAAS